MLDPALCVDRYEKPLTGEQRVNYGVEGPHQLTLIGHLVEDEGQAVGIYV